MRLIRWFAGRFKETLEYDALQHFWIYGVSYFLTVLTALMMIYTNPTVNTLSIKLIESAQVFMMVTFGFLILSLLLAFLFSLLYIPLPRFSLASLLITVSLLTFVFWESKSGLQQSLIIGVSVPLIFILATFIFSLLWRWHYMMFGVVFLGLIICLAFGLSKLYDTQHQYFVDDKNVPFELLSKGDYDTKFYTYGSGRDIKREAFGSSVDAVTPSVDASDFIHRWKNNREDFWGFTPENLPINGRVFMPEGEGPFPVILMVHGNHSMEEYSTDGYDYLGEHLASKGYVFISADEDFVNYSYYSSQPNDNYILRTWLILQHLIQLKEMNQTDDNFMYDKLDLSNVGLAGHSRGGQAVAMAADYLTFFEDDFELQEAMEDIRIASVLAISPTDKQVDDKRAKLVDTSYMTIQGAQDADVYRFYGDSQYGRTVLNQSYANLKAAVYIEKANHVHFNTSWGHTDLSVPRGLVLDRFSLIPDKTQQELAKVYATAFFESTLSENMTLRSFFTDIKDWTNIEILTKAQTNRYKPITMYQNVEDIALEGAKDIEIAYTKGRSNNPYYKQALQFDWDKETKYKLSLDKTDLQNNIYIDGENLLLTMANLTPNSNPRLEVTLESDTKSIKYIQKLSPVIESDFTHFGLFDNIFREGKYEKSWEPTYETLAIPLDEIGDTDHLDVIFEFKADKGRLAILEIGVE